MNKYLFILGLVGTALFTACSTSDDLTAEETPVTPVEEPKETTLVVEARQNSEIPITLGAGSGRAMTRAPFDNETDVFSTPFDPDDPSKNRYIGVFCLATGYQPLYEANPPIENNWTNNDATGLIMRMNNVPAIVQNSSVRFPNIPSLSTADPLADVYYYPMGNWMKYNFYAYYPWQNEGDDSRTLTFKNNRVLEKYYEIDGSQDIIWGMAHPEEAQAVSPAVQDAFPYSSKYIRLKRNEVGEEHIAEHYPKMKLYHKLVQFRFFVKAADAATLDVIGPYNSETEKGMNMQVTDMYIGNAINRLELVVADQSGEYDGDLFWFGNDLATEELHIKTKGKVNTDRFDQDGDGDLDHPFIISSSEVDEVLTFTAVEAVEYNEGLVGAVSAGEDVPDDYQEKVGEEPSGEVLTAVEAAKYNATLAGAVKEGDEKSVGYIMLAPPSLPSFNATFSNNPPEEPETNKHIYQLYLKVKYDTAPGKPDPKPTTNVLALSLDPSVVDLEKFDEGKIYNIIVNVQSPEQISATAVLQEWQPGGTYQY